MIRHHCTTHVWGPSIRFPNFWISTPTQRWSEVPLVAQHSSEFPQVNATNRTVLVCSVTVLCLLEWRHVLLAGQIFQQLRMGDFHEQRVCVKFCFKLGKTFSETFKMLKLAFWENAMSRTQTHEWYECSKEGWTSNEDNEHSGWPSTSKKRIKHPNQKMIHSHHCLIICEVAEEGGFSKTTCH